MSEKKTTDWIIAITAIVALVISCISLYFAYFYQPKGFSAQYFGLRLNNSQKNVYCKYVVFSNVTDFDYGVSSVSFTLDYQGGSIQQDLSLVSNSEPFVVKAGGILIKKYCFKMEYDDIPLEKNTQIDARLISRINFIRSDGEFDYKDFYVNDIRFKGLMLSGTFPGDDIEKFILDE